MTNDLQFVVINKRRIIAKPFYLEALLKAHKELTDAQIGVNNQLGFVLGMEQTSSWRSLVMQEQLLAKGLTRTLASNHRRGTAVDVFPDLDYVKKIIPIMKKHNLVNDLGAWDQVHFNWSSNSTAMSYPIFNELPLLLKEFSMNEYENHIIQLTEPNVPESGMFALVLGGVKRKVGKSRMAEAAMTVLFRGMQPSAVNKKLWDSIPDGKPF